MQLAKAMFLARHGIPSNSESSLKQNESNPRVCHLITIFYQSALALLGYLQ